MMMQTSQLDRRWLAGGVLGAVVLLALAWFVVIGPQRAETAALQEKVEATTLETAKLEMRLTQLRKDGPDPARTAPQLAAAEAALPATAGMAEFLRQLDTAGKRAGVQVTDVQVSDPTQPTGTTTKVFALPLKLTASGSDGNLERFLDELQQTGPRAVLISSANLANPPNPGVPSALTLGLQAFVAPALGAAQPAGTAK